MHRTCALRACTHSVCMDLECVPAHTVLSKKCRLPTRGRHLSGCSPPASPSRTLYRRSPPRSCVASCRPSAGTAASGTGYATLRRERACATLASAAHSVTAIFVGTTAAAMASASHQRCRSQEGPRRPAPPLALHGRRRHTPSAYCQLPVDASALTVSREMTARCAGAHTTAMGTARASMARAHALRATLALRVTLPTAPPCHAATAACAPQLACAAARTVSLVLTAVLTRAVGHQWCGCHRRLHRRYRRSGRVRRRRLRRLLHRPHAVSRCVPVRTAARATATATLQARSARAKRALLGAIARIHTARSSARDGGDASAARVPATCPTQEPRVSASSPTLRLRRRRRGGGMACGAERQRWCCALCWAASSGVSTKRS